jgi:hypothetical protein
MRSPVSRGQRPVAAHTSWKKKIAWHRHTHASDDETRHQPDDAIAMLTADHCQVRVLFQQYEDTPDPYLKQIIATLRDLYWQQRFHDRWGV